MKYAVLLWASALIIAPDVGRAEEPATFRFTITSEPTGADPARISSSESNYFIFNVQRGLYVVDGAGDLQPEIAKKCEWVKSHTKLRCEIKDAAKWSDGKSIRAIDFVESWRRLVAPKTKGLGVTILSGIKNGGAIHAGSMPVDRLGVIASADKVLEITLEKEDSEFIQRLAHPALSVTRSDFTYDRENAVKAPASGPYRVADWKSATRIRLEPNPYYDTIQKTAPRPPVEILVIEEDETALNLYREGTLSFLRRLPAAYLKTWKDSKELHQIPVARFDYFAFGPALRGADAFREALASALDFGELQTILAALGPPGCPGIEPQWMDAVPCLKFDLKKAQRAWAKVPDELRNRHWVLNFSRLGGDDIQKAVEWMQNQWKKNLGLITELKPVEQSVYMAQLKKAPPDLFRKGVGLDRATCLAAVEIFTKGDPENFIGLDSPAYEKAVERLRGASTSVARKQACTEVVKLLVDRSEIIPLGRIHFSVLAKPEFDGWVLNPLNNLDLSRLHTVTKH